MNQLTLKAPFSVKGKSLHTGQIIEATFKPAPDNHGYKFKRIDLEGQPLIDGVAENVVDTTRGTVLGRGDVRISTVEHALAALYALGVDNCLIELDGPELPILDGSASEYVRKIEEIGLEEQEAEKDFYIIKEKTQIKDEKTGSMITLYPDDSFSVEVMVEYNSPVLPNQFAILDDMADFSTEVASARTFVFVREIQALLENGLIKGGDLENAIVIYDHPISQDKIDEICDLMQVERMHLNKLGYINPSPLKWDNEPARHKLMDVIGDLSLIGRPLKCRVVAIRPGHTINSVLTKKIRKEIKHTEIQSPLYNPNDEPIIDNVGIRKLLPHRYPFLLIDKVIELDRKHCVAVKNVTANEPFFQGHFPQEPVMPGVLQVEAMAQAAGVLVLNFLDDPDQYSTYFLKIDNVKFRQKVVPGSTLLLTVSLMTEIRRGCAVVKGYAFVGDKIACEAEFMAQIIKNNKR
ncbi:MAG: bifunctional UDP-3-O-[3-hydroxymyristoyl] N-acetylglucosamine deacetylase/3-hydroxyacyl-ACP dehydratase [Clostridium sp.]|nr:bifunctional UDP-3-O-[3-hydroxymyristoyl] N-acetylglucosamine deacetylase/3-hydroxyacyl-ACP dehydratase [Prevotella sp.]MCM1428705.1 bifunctional UDP-3-O-[3-hydroxymyristoyl] N-acetylglucosamine deacetylase/3-hydroxyacyl-ACP dehydratase [Clostridium sp.]